MSNNNLSAYFSAVHARFMGKHESTIGFSKRWVGSTDYIDSSFNDDRLWNKVDTDGPQAFVDSHRRKAIAFVADGVRVVAFERYTAPENESSKQPFLLSACYCPAGGPKDVMSIVRPEVANYEGIQKTIADTVMALVEDIKYVPSAEGNTTNSNESKKEETMNTNAANTEAAAKPAKTKAPMNPTTKKVLIGAAAAVGTAAVGYAAWLAYRHFSGSVSVGDIAGAIPEATDAAVSVAQSALDLTNG